MKPIWLARLVWSTPMPLGAGAIIALSHWLNLSGWIGIPIAVAVMLLAYVGSIFFWGWIARVFGWEIPIDEWEADDLHESDKP